MIRYLCWLADYQRPNTITYEYVVIDRERDARFSVKLELLIGSIRNARARGVDLLAMEDARTVRALWSGVKRSSPGTFLEARDLGWLPTA